jgi:aminoglycoside phosphotransferase (APT) family kinase protein
VRPWTAEVVVDARLARRLIGQFPELTVESLLPLAEGWDRAIWLVNQRWVFGFPRRAVAVPGIEREMTLLPRLAPLLPLPIPRPVFLGRPADGYPWPFFGGAFLPGHEACDASLDDAARIAVALDLAAFLRRLHSGEVAAAIGAAELPADPNGRADMARRVPMACEALTEVERLELWQPPPSVAHLLGEARRLPSSTQPVTITHGDLHVRHLLVHAGRASGVIDWVDLCLADPAIDLQLVWSFVPLPARGAFLDAYGHVTEEQLLRARVLALWLCAVLARYAHEQGVTSVEREAIAGLQRAASG